MYRYCWSILIYMSKGFSVPKNLWRIFAKVLSVRHCPVIYLLIWSDAEGISFSQTEIFDLTSFLSRRDIIEKRWRNLNTFQFYIVLRFYTNPAVHLDSRSFRMAHKVRTRKHFLSLSLSCPNLTVPIFSFSMKYMEDEILLYEVSIQAHNYVSLDFTIFDCNKKKGHYTVCNFNQHRTVYFLLRWNSTMCIGRATNVELYRHLFVLSKPFFQKR